VGFDTLIRHGVLVTDERRHATTSLAQGARYTRGSRARLERRCHQSPCDRTRRPDTAC
jgi:hypothetical protein